MINLSSHKAFSIYLLFAALFLGVQMFQGLSYLDIGMYMSGYQHFTSDPYASYFLGQWILTYDVTSALCKLFSINSFLGLRVLHLVYVLVTQTVVYLYLRQYISTRSIITGLLIATLAHYGSYTEINYNDYSALLLLFSILCYHGGADRDNQWIIMMGGVLAGVAVYLRIVNITYICLPLCAMLISKKWNNGHSPSNGATFFYIGMCFGGLLGYVVLLCQGLDNVFALTFNDIAGISSDKSDTHGMLYVMRSMYDLYTEVVANAGYIMLFWIIIVAGMKQTRRIMRITLVAVAIVLTLVMMNFSFFPSNITMALCLIGGVGVFFIRGVYPPLAHLVMISLFLPFVMPVGSNAEPSFYGKETCFLTLPLVMYVLFEELMPKKEQLERRAAMCMIGVLGAGLLFFNLTHKQMEEGNRIACRYTVDSQLTRGILTTKENADMYNYLIREVKPHIRQGSYMICSFSLPAVSILDCKPWAVYSTVYSTDRMNDRYIKVAWKHTKELPYVLLDEENLPDGYKHIMEELSLIRKYQKIWTDGKYSLYYSKPYPGPERPKITDVEPYRHHP